jgi:hypothetical protein
MGSSSRTTITAHAQGEEAARRSMCWRDRRRVIRPLLEVWSLPLDSVDKVESRKT